MKTVFKKDHYETDIILECFNCKVLEIKDNFIFFRVQEPILKRLEDIKRDINVLVNRNQEFYCDCKKLIKNGKIFEEALKVENGNFEFQLDKIYNLKILFYSIKLSKSSYGPLLKVIESNQISESFETLNFLQDQSETDSDEEIQTHFEIYNKINLKNEKCKRIKKKGNANSN